jgi:outer membrane protein OmpA-like peptidoglycan-associated protein
VITTDTKRVISADKIQFLPKVNSQIEVESWKVEAKQGDKVLASFSDKGTPPQSLDWVIDSKSKNSPTTSGNITYCLDVTDKLGRSLRSNCYNLPVEQITINKKRNENIKDKEFEYYSLILFDYGKSNLLKEHSKVLNFIKGRITPDAVVYVKGYTDQMGDEETNAKIADRRANSVGNNLKIKKENVVGLGEKDILYDNSTPEGRFYCRTVRIEIETPVVK